MNYKKWLIEDLQNLERCHFQILSEIRGLQAKRARDKEANLRAAMPYLNDFFVDYQ